jgi:uncharacterized protein (DUF305 family)
LRVKRVDPRETRVNSRPVKVAICSHNIETTVTRGLISVALICVSVGGSAACATATVQSGPPIIQPGAPGQASQVITAEKAVDLSKVQHTEADVQFMQGMIGHHSQALEMTELLSTRTNSDDMRKLALRIEASQSDEIKMMQEWLKRRGQPLPDPHAHHHGGKLMPGMLTAEDMGRLAAATGVEFDRLFLELMIKHHEGALVMVKDLFATAGAGQESEIFAFASDVDSDQRMEIDRMSAMLAKSKEFEQ